MTDDYDLSDDLAQLEQRIDDLEADLDRRQYGPVAPLARLARRLH